MNKNNANIIEKNNKVNWKFILFACCTIAIIILMSMNLGKKVGKIVESSNSNETSNIVINQDKYNGNITRFKYSYGSYNSGYYNYDIIVDNGIVTLNAKGYNGIDLNINKEIDSLYLIELAQIINEKDIYKWNTFAESDDSVLDGASFSIEVYYSDGKELKASGYMKYPQDYKKCHEALVTFFEKLNS